MKIITKKIVLSEPISHCSDCNNICSRHTKGLRKIWHIENDKVVLFECVISKFYCAFCKKYFSQLISLAPKGSSYSYEIIKSALTLMGRGMSLSKVSNYFRKTHGLHIPITTLHFWTQRIKKDRK